MNIYTNINEIIPKNCVASIGFFDGVHKGHEYIVSELQKRANEKGVEELLISLWPHPSVFFNRPIKLLSTYEEKIEQFKSLNVKNLLFLEFNHELASLSRYDFTKSILQEKLGISELIMGYNNSIGRKDESQNDDRKTDLPFSRLDKIQISGKDVNSSIIRTLIKEGKVEEAEEVLGYAYQITGKIISGYKIGRRIGFPTGNLGRINDLKLIPGNGVYVAEALINNKWLPAMLNIGTRPSFDGKEQSIEFNILNFNSNLYDKTITVRFRKRIREEIKFENIDKLVEQLNKDRELTIKFFS